MKHGLKRKMLVSIFGGFIILLAAGCMVSDGSSTGEGMSGTALQEAEPAATVGQAVAPERPEAALPVISVMEDIKADAVPETSAITVSDPWRLRMMSWQASLIIYAGMITSLHRTI